MLSEARGRKSEVCIGGRRIERVNIRCKSETRWYEGARQTNTHVGRVGERGGGNDLTMPVGMVRERTYPMKRHRRE